MSSSRLDGKLAVVTAAASGIGKATALGLARRGARVIGVDLNADGLAVTIAQVEAEGGEGTARVMNCLDREAVEAGFIEIAERYGDVDILVNAVGQPTKGNVYREFYESDPDSWSFVIDICLRTAMLCTRQVVPGMRDRGRGRIVNISSVSWMVPPPITFTEYAAAKAGIVGFTRGVANELAPFGVTVNCVSPGPVGSEQTDLQPAELRAKVLSTVPMARYGNAEEIAAGILFLASDEASYITGHNLVISGGRAMS